MNSFTLQDTKKTFDIKNTAGEVLKTFSVDVGNYETIERWSKDIEKIEALQKGIKENGSMESLKEFEEELITRMLGAEAWAWLWDVTNHNVVQLVRFLSDFQTFINKQQAESLKGYV